MPPLYLDYNATTPLDPRVFAAMTPFFLEDFGNAGSRTHLYGQRAKEAVEAARAQVAAVLGLRPEEVIFTSGATESNNLALLGLVEYGLETRRRHVLSTAIEHKAVLEPLERMQKLGFEVELAPVTRGGYVEPETIRQMLRPDTLVISVMHANNETGVIQPLEEIGDILAGSETFFHTDAAQTFGKEVESLRKIRWDFVSISGHKIYGPKGIGALGVRRRPGKRRPLAPLLYGGGQERGLRPGTLPVPLVVGLGKAAELAAAEHAERRQCAENVKRSFLAALEEVEHQINGDLERAQPHVVNISFPGIDSEALMMSLRDDIAISSGSACTSAAFKPSHVLAAMGVDDARIESAVRVSWGLYVGSSSCQSLIAAVCGLRPCAWTGTRVQANLRPAKGPVRDVA
jgi:cysteine desulfurase